MICVRISSSTLGKLQSDAFQSTIEVIESFVDLLFELLELEDRHVFVLDRVKVLVERSDGCFVGCTGVL